MRLPPLFLAVAMLLMLVSCASEQDSGYVRATIDGKPMLFTVEADATVAGNNGRIQHVVFAALSSEDHGKPAMRFDVEQEGGEIVPGRYAKYGDVAGRYYWQTSNDGTYMHKNGPDDPFQITFTRIDRERVEGRFSGQFSHIDPDFTVQVTQGEFSLPVVDN
jgi:hypothetical protein